MADDLLGRIGNLLNRRPWYELPRLLAAGRLVEMRNELREKNLHDTEEPAFATQPIPANVDPTLREGRTHRRLATTTWRSRRWAAPAGASAATSRSSTRRRTPPTCSCRTRAPSAAS